jgi:hypothetical protein
VIGWQKSPTTKNQLTPQIVFTTAIELDHQQIATLNRLVLASPHLSDDEALDLWQVLNPFVQAFNHANPRDVFSGLRVVALAKPATGEPEPPYSAELLTATAAFVGDNRSAYVFCSPPFTKTILWRKTMTPNLTDNATRNALINAIKEHIDPDKPQSVNIKRYIIKQYKPDDPTGQDKLAKFAWELHHGNRNIRNRDHVVELFQLLTIEATGLEQRKANTAKSSPLKEAVFKVLKTVAGQDILMIVALNELKDEISIKTIANWDAFLDQLTEKRSELEAIADTVYELAGVSPGALDELSAVIVPLYNQVREKNIKSVNWENQSWWDWAHKQLLEQVGTAA